jgi:SHS2 domain-containing protein
MEPYRFIDITTADVAFEAAGETLEDVFANSALAMFEVMTDTKKVKPDLKTEIDVKGTDLKSLLFNFLNEMLVYVDSESLIFSKFIIAIDQKDMTLSAACYGERIDKTKHEIRTEVKAATYHQMEIRKNTNWHTRVILDI